MLVYNEIAVPFYGFCLNAKSIFLSKAAKVILNDECQLYFSVIKML